MAERIFNLVEKTTGEARYVGLVDVSFRALWGDDLAVVHVMPQGFQLIARSDELRVLARDLGETRARAAGLALTIQRATDDMALLVAGPHPEAARGGAQDARVEAARRSGTGEVSDRAATLAARVA